MALRDKNQLAEQLYVHAGLSQKEISKQLKVTEKTIGIWKRKGNWDELKAAHTITKDEILANLYMQILGIQDAAKDDNRVLNAKESDQIYKLAKSIESIDKRISLSIIIQIFKDFENFLAPLDAKLTRKINEYHTQFIHKQIDV